MKGATQSNLISPLGRIIAPWLGVLRPLRSCTLVEALRWTNILPENLCTFFSILSAKIFFCSWFIIISGFRKDLPEGMTEPQIILEAPNEYAKSHISSSSSRFWGVTVWATVTGIPKFDNIKTAFVAASQLPACCLKLSCLSDVAPSIDIWNHL